MNVELHSVHQMNVEKVRFTLALRKSNIHKQSTEYYIKRKKEALRTRLCNLLPIDCSCPALPFEHFLVIEPQTKQTIAKILNHEVVLGGLSQLLREVTHLESFESSIVTLVQPFFLDQRNFCSVLEHLEVVPSRRKCRTLHLCGLWSIPKTQETKTQTVLSPETPFAAKSPCWVD